MLGIISSVVGGIFGIGKQYMQRKQEEAQAKHERKLKVIKGEQDWDMIQAKNSGESWKDEFITLVVFSPFIGMFVAVLFGDVEMVERFKQAFIVLDSEVPEEYWYLLSAITAASFGIKKIVEGVQKIRNK